MKRFLIVLALVLVAPVFGQTAGEKIIAGRAALAARDLPTAQLRFQEALAITPTSQTAAALLGITRLFALPGHIGTTAFLNGAGVSPTGRNIYDWTAKLPTNSEGNEVLPANY